MILQQQQEEEEKDDDGTKAKEKRNSRTFFLISKGRERYHRTQTLVYVRANKYVPEIIRYFDTTTKKTRKFDASSVLSHCLQGQTETVTGKYVPKELICGQIHTSATPTSSISNNSVGGGDLNRLIADLETREASMI